MNPKWNPTLVAFMIIMIVVATVSACTFESPSGRSLRIDGDALSGVVDSAGNAAARYRDARTSSSNPERD